MSDDNSKQIPTLEDVVKVGASFKNDDQPGNANTTDSLWISDWQEEVMQSAVTAGTGIKDQQQDTPITDQEQSEIIAAVVADETRDDSRSNRHNDITSQHIDPVSPANSKTTSAGINTSELANQIVSELMPEIEWKLRTKIREVLDQRFPPED